MCVSGCHEVLSDRLLKSADSRRSFLRKSLSAAAMGIGAGAVPSLAACTLRKESSPQSAASENGTEEISFSRMIDLTHTLHEDFPTYFGGKALEHSDMMTFAKDGLNVKKLSYAEHIGTHIDAPIHFSENGIDCSEIPVDQLCAPLCIVDISERAAENPDTELTPDDITAYEKRFGRIPAGSCLAMNSGWTQRADSEKFRNADAKGKMHFPGIHPEASQFLLEQRDLVGIAVDTLSLDKGTSEKFGTHYSWLPSGRWGVECIALSGEIPPSGAHILIGAPSFAGGTGGPSRIFALL